MGSDSKVEYKGIHHTNVSSRVIVLEELHRLKEKLSSTPFPFCELDCPWLCLCRIIIPPGCILNDLIVIELISDQ